MATIRQINTESWDELSSHIDNLFTHFNNYIFRGHADSEWKIESTLTRALNRIYPDGINKVDLAKKHLDSFMHDIRGKCTLDFKFTSDDEKWALGQHHGLYTPLLDWTDSPYVGLFFALQGNSNSGKRTLWALLEDDIQELSDAQAANGEEVEVIRPLSNENRRLVSQGGLFLKAPLEISIENWISQQRDFDWVTMYKIEFPDNIKNDALSALNNMNINNLTLFPDLIGSSSHSNYRLEIEPHLIKMRDEVWKNHRQSEQPE